MGIDLLMYVCAQHGMMRKTVASQFECKELPGVAVSMSIDVVQHCDQCVYINAVVLHDISCHELPTEENVIASAALVDWQLVMF